MNINTLTEDNFEKLSQEERLSLVYQSANLAAELYLNSFLKACDDQGFSRLMYFHAVDHVATITESMKTKGVFAKLVLEIVEDVFGFMTQEGIVSSVSRVELQPDGNFGFLMKAEVAA